MSQTQYLLIAEVVFLGGMVLLWFAKRRHDGRRSDLQSHSLNAVRARRTGVGRKASKAVRLAARNVPVPWGWPNCGSYRARRYKPSMKEAMHALADCLFREKQLVTEAGVDPRIRESLRALIEDRYHPVGTEQIPEVPYRRVTSPLLPSSRAPRDPMEHFGRQQAFDKDVWLTGVGPVESVRAAADEKLRIARAEVRELKRPWGW